MVFVGFFFFLAVTKLLFNSSKIAVFKSLAFFFELSQVTFDLNGNLDLAP